MSNDCTLRVGRLEDKFKLYEPLLTELQGLVSLPAVLDQINVDLRTLKDSRIEVREKMTTLFKTQSRGYDDVVQKLEERTRAQEKEIEDCPINDVVPKVATIEQDIGKIKDLSTRLKAAEGSIESFKLKGWDLLFRIVPWVLAACMTTWALLGK